MVGIFADPVYKGDYPQSVKARVPSGTLMPLSANLAADLNGSMDFFALNHYTSQCAAGHSTPARALLACLNIVALGHVQTGG
jgi:beta-glucosidase/6-phospho-beta-glucosidase/beta-galactosidase